MRIRRDGGQALLLVLVIAALLAPLAAGFVSAMSLQQRLAGERLRAVSALYLAEAGVEKTFWYLEGEAPDGSRDASWRPRSHTEELHADTLRGRFTLDARDESDGVVSIRSWGEVGRTRRGVRVVAWIASAALDHALFGAGLLAVEGDQARLSLTEVLEEGCAPRVMVVSAAELWFRTPGSRVEFRPCADDPMLYVGLPDALRLTIGDVHGAARYLGLRQFGIDVGPVEVREIRNEVAPTPDVAGLRRRAASNVANEEVNRIAGEAANRPELRDKRHSLYTAEEFALVLRHLRGRTATLLGPVFVEGHTVILADVPLTISEGFLAARGAVTVEPGARLTVRHGPTSRFLPGLVTIGAEAALVVGEGAKVTVDGVVLAEGIVDIREGATVEVVGSLIAASSQRSLRLNNGTLSIRYDPAAPGTWGLRPQGGRLRAVPLTWHEIR